MEGGEKKTMLKSEKTITFKSSDGVVFTLDKKVARALAVESQTIRGVIQDNLAGSIPVINVKSEVLNKVMEYCHKHIHRAANPSDTSGSGDAAEQLNNWDADFVKVGQAMLYDLIMAARYLNIKGLLHLTCKAVSDMIRGKTPEEIRKTLSIMNNFNPEEEEEIRREM